ncbi:GIN domain-containing protein [Flavobacterium suzhouense]|uniref:GIN domain-containing protein n=1 Tax=Flavobacterium suzhouense TaxID=1529638 RepID=A0ABW5NTT3_9FLAO
MKTLFTLAAIAAINLVTAQKTENLKEFKSLVISGDVDVTLIKSSENKAVIKNGEEELQIQNEKGALAINGDGSVVVYYTAAIENISAGPDTELIGNDEISTKEFNLAAAADSKVKLVLNVKNLNVAAAADSQVKIEGKADVMVAAVASDAQYDVKELKANNVEIVLASDAQASITAKGTVDATVASDGSLTIYGNPKKVNEVKSDDAQIVVVK